MDPPWDAPLDVEATIAAVPENATMKGMFTAGLLELATERAIPLERERDEYEPLRDYPLAEHVRMLVAVTRAVFPDEPLRQGLRRIGRGAPRVMLASAIGPATVGAANGPLQTVREICKAYPLLLAPGEVSLVDATERCIVVRLTDIAFFADCHHIGVFEGALRHAGIEELDVCIRESAPNAVDLRLTWESE